MKNNGQLTRRHVMGAIGTVGAMAVGGMAWKPVEVRADTCLSCVVRPQETEGPYFVDELLNRSDIRVDPSDGIMRPGTQLNLTINVNQIDNGCCTPITGATVDIWHCDAGGTYSDRAEMNSVGKKYLRGYQVSDTIGKVKFTTVYPGWYQGRTVHLHFKVRVYTGTQKTYEFTSQLFFDDALTDQIFQAAPYLAKGIRDTRNSNDGIYNGATADGNGDQLLIKPVKNGDVYEASFDVGLKIKLSKPAITGDTAVANAASYAAGATPGSWFTIFGSDFTLASFTQTMAQSDIVGGKMPTSLGGVSALINNKPAYLYFVSATQINGIAPDDTTTGPVQVTVTNSAGTSAAVRTNLQVYQPAFFLQSAGVIMAVRPDGSLVGATVAQGGPGGGGGGTPPGGGGGMPGGGTPPTGPGRVTMTPAKPGETVLLFGTGFGPVTPAVAAGQVFQGAASLASASPVTIGGVTASISFAGMASSGIYQFNLVVPEVADGDQEVIATVGGVKSPVGTKMTVKKS